MPSDPPHRRARRCAILAGGRASRLGGRKATAMVAGMTLVDRVAASALEAGLEPLVVAKPSTALAEVTLPVLLEPEQPLHPLIGIATALEAVAEPLVVCPCDLPLIGHAALGRIAEEAAELAVVEHAGRIEPLLGRFEPGLAPALAEAAATGAAATATVVELGARRLSASDLGLGAPASVALANVNEPADLERIGRQLER